jgi:hypothetical protein
MVKLALVVVVVALLVLAIDYRLKNYIIREGQVALGLLTKAQALADEARRDGQARADNSGAVDGGGVGAADGVGDDAGARTHVDSAANGRPATPVRRKTGPRGGPGRDG